MTSTKKKFKYVFDRTPLEAGQSRIFKSLDEGQISLEIKCFVRDPPPPGFRPCKECGLFFLEYEQVALVRANSELFENGGTLQVTLIDRERNKETIDLQVFPEGSTPRGGGFGGGGYKPRTGYRGVSK